MHFEDLKRGRIRLTNFTRLDEANLLEILEWRNDINIRSQMVNSELISPHSHLNFCSKLVNQKESIYWLVRRKDVSCGVVYLHRLANDYSKSEWGYYTSTKFHGSGVGMEIAYESIQLFYEIIGVKLLYGYIKVTNLENLRMQKVLGFRQLGVVVKNSQELIETVRDSKFTEMDFKSFQKRVIYGGYSKENNS